MKRRRGKKYQRLKMSAAFIAKQKANLRRGWTKSRAKQQHGLCAICSEPFHKTIPALVATCDHIIPLSKGGIDHYDNVQAAHYRCNQKKADKIFS